MPMLLPEHLTNATKNGDLVLVLGAGASVTSKNGHGKPVLDGGKLASLLAKEAGLTYDNETLQQVMEATKDILGDPGFEKHLRNQFENCEPSDELKILLTFTWYRIYTFNYDDCIKNSPKSRRAQVLVFRNAMKDRRDEHSGYNKCQVIHLHGIASEYSSGIVGSDTDYASSKHSLKSWYEQLGEDFFNKTVVFLGSKLDEHLFVKFISRYKEIYGSPGRSYLILPDELSPIRLGSLRAKGIDFIKGTTRDFAESLSLSFPGGMSPTGIDQNSAIIRASAKAGLSFSSTEVEALRGLFPISERGLARSKIDDQYVLSRIGRDYLNGFGPTWEVVANNVYATLRQYKDIQELFEREMYSRRMMVVTGESGSGKSTCCMSICYNLASTLKDTEFFEYRANSSSFLDVFRTFNTYIGSSKRGIILIDSLHIYVDDVAEALQSIEAPNICIVASARLSEWKSRIEKQLPTQTLSVELKRFEPRDADSIVLKIDAYLPVPAFNKLSHSDKIAKLLKSRRQLLIALKEETSSEKFDDIIEDEFQQIDDPAARLLLVLIAVATIARTGLFEAVSRQIFASLRPDDRFEDALSNLSGIVGIGSSGRLQARHEIYAKHIVNETIDIEDFVAATKGLLEYFCRYNVPVIKHVSKLDGQLFKFILNNLFIYETFKRANAQSRSAEVYSPFETKLQRDGHFWLQFGLLERRMGNQQRAFQLLRLSVDAYTNNPYAHTALAQQKLILAALQPKLDSKHQRLMSEAVDYLTEEHYRRVSDRRIMSVDEYPLSTLGYYHIDALVQHGERNLAVAAAKKYFELLKETPFSRNSGFLEELKSKLLMYISTGNWSPLKFRKGQISYVS